MKQQKAYWQTNISLHTKCPYCRNEEYFDYYDLTIKLKVEPEDLGVQFDNFGLEIECSECERIYIINQTVNE